MLSMPRCGAPMIDGWYSLIAGVCPAPRGVLETPGVRRLPRPLLNRLLRWSATRGVLLFAASVRHPAVGIARDDPGWATLLLLRAVFGRRPKLIAFQFILHPRRHPLRALIKRYDRWAIRRTLLRGHALTLADRRELAEHYGLPIERFSYIPWPLAVENAAAQLPPAPRTPLVLSAGRAYCDWETLFAAARGAGWPLVVVCKNADRRKVDALNSDGQATVLSELPREEFWELMDRATVGVVAMVERGTSQGHIRIQEAHTRGVPLVITATDSLEDYVEDGETAVLVPPGDASGLRTAVDRLLASPDEREHLRRTAHGRALRWQVPHYFESLTYFAHGDPVRLPPTAPGAASVAALGAGK